MLAVVGISATGVDDTMGALDELGARVGDKRVPLTRTAEILHSHLEAAYDTEGGAGGSGPWVPLTPAYGAWKAKHGPGVPKLIGLRPNAKGTQQDPNRNDTYSPSGRMRRQVLAPVQNKTAWQITTEKMRFRVNSRIAIFHQTGTSKMAPRPPVDPPPVFLTELDGTFIDWLNDLIESSGL